MQSWQGRSRTLNDFFVMMYLHLNSEYGQSQRTVSSIGVGIRDRPLIKFMHWWSGISTNLNYDLTNWCSSWWSRPSSFYKLVLKSLPVPFEKVDIESDSSVHKTCLQQSAFRFSRLFTEKWHLCVAGRFVRDVLYVRDVFYFLSL